MNMQKPLKMFSMPRLSHWLSVKASAPGFDFCLGSGDFSRLSHTSDLKIGTPGATLPDTWHYRFNAGTGWPGVRPAYASVFFCISAEIGQQYGSTLVFLKIQTQNFQKVWKTQREQCEFVASEAIDGELSFVDICIFQAISRPEVHGRS